MRTKERKNRRVAFRRRPTGSLTGYGLVAVACSIASMLAVIIVGAVHVRDVIAYAKTFAASFDRQTIYAIICIAIVGGLYLSWDRYWSNRRDARERAEQQRRSRYSW